MRLKTTYESRIAQLDEQVRAVRTKERRLAELERMKHKAEGACRKLEGDIAAIKQQKVRRSRHRWLMWPLTLWITDRDSPAA
jgi:hypothetical protein